MRPMRNLIIVSTGLALLAIVGGQAVRLFAQEATAEKPAVGASRTAVSADDTAQPAAASPAAAG